MVSEISDFYGLDGNKFCSNLNVLFLADFSHPANVVRDHIDAVRKGLGRRCVEINPIRSRPPNVVKSASFDAVVIHYSIYTLGSYFFPSDWRDFVKNFDGFKAQFIQDEYRHIDEMNDLCLENGIDVVYSILDKNAAEVVYKPLIEASVPIITSLPGYIADEYLKSSFCPLNERAYDVVYRGRELPANLGRHALKKSEIGRGFSKIANRKGLVTDIDWTEESRIYGSSWFEFLGNSRCTLGVEGGMSIFDFSGVLERLWYQIDREFPGLSEVEKYDRFFSGFEGNLVYKTITPKFFEAICARTALILYPGSYSGILAPGKDFIVLEEDFSNIEDVVKMIRDPIFLEDLVTNLYEKVTADRSFLQSSFSKALESSVFQLISRKNMCSRTHRVFKGLINWMY